MAKPLQIHIWNWFLHFYKKKGWGYCHKCTATSVLQGSEIHEYKCSSHIIQKCSCLQIVFLFCFCFKLHLLISLEKQNKDAIDIKHAYKSPHHFLKMFYEEIFITRHTAVPFIWYNLLSGYHIHWSIQKLNWCTVRWPLSWSFFYPFSWMLKIH